MVVDVSWVDAFARSISEYVYVRERDSLLILLPNQAYKLNHTGLALLKQVLQGKPIVDVLESRAPGTSADEAILRDVHAFFCDVRALVMGCLGDGSGRLAVEEVPFERPHNTLPVLSEIALTYRCNLNCRFCYAGCRCKTAPPPAGRGWGGGHAQPGGSQPLPSLSLKGEGAREMTTDQVKRVLDIIRCDAEVPSVSWTGGEPTLRPDLVELTHHAAGIGMRVNLITNGTNLDSELVSHLKDAGLRSAQVSLEGPTAEVHDGLTQVAGSFERTLEGIRLLRDAELHVHTNTTVNRVNAEQLVGIVALAKEIGLDRCSMNMVIPCGSAPNADVTITYTRMAELVDVAKRAARAQGMQFLWYSPTPYCIYNPIAARLGGKSCAACDGLLSVAPNGDVLPCSSLPRSVGNLLKTPFDKVWEGRKARYWRDKRYAHKICRECEHFDICTGACPIYWDTMGYGELRAVQRDTRRREVAVA